MDYVACAPTTTYRGGGFFEDAALLAQMADPNRTVQGECRLLAEVFPPFSALRPAPVSLITSESDFAVSLQEQMAVLNRERRQGAASALVCLEGGFLHSNVLYTRSSAGVRVVYETYRANDRPYVPLIDPLTSAYAHEPLSDSEVLDLFIGSAGTGNYGHWLVDDLPRAAAVEALRAEAGARPIRIWLSDAGEPMNAVRAASLRKVCEAFGPIEVRVARLDRIYDFKRLHYVTPVSYHPVLKSPAATRWLATKYAGGLGGKRLFVSRNPERSRSLLNVEAVWNCLAALDFEAIEVEGMSFDEQASNFAQADVIVGCMGAAMTNAVFARSGIAVLYLAPQGWVEPFYWDLAAVCGHQYHAIYGPVSTPDLPAHLASFTIDMAQLERGLAALQL